MPPADEARARSERAGRAQRTQPEPFSEHRDFLWGLCYRMTGSAADADDLVQETFVRALERPPPDASLPWRPWLTRVAVNLARDLLRRRKRREYPGTWLPTPVQTPSPEEPGMPPEAALGFEATPEARYSAMESASFAFLLAVEALTPTQRAVLILRDVLDLSVKETSEALDISEVNVKTTLHRARSAMSSYQGMRSPPTAALARELEGMLGRLMLALRTGDLEGTCALLASDVRALSDGGGVAFAARRPVEGADKVASMYLKLTTRSSSSALAEIRTFNGLPAAIVDDPDAQSPNAKRAVISIALDAHGRIAAIHSVLAPAKLLGIPPVRR